jgi:hypothetical protein
MRSSLACFNFSVSDLIYRLDFSIGSSLELILARPLLGCTNARSLIIEQGVDVSIQNLPENPDTMTDRDHHIESRHQTINYVGYNGLINTTTIDFNGTRRYNERNRNIYPLFN